MKKKIKHELVLIMGKPGSGKSTLMAHLVKKSIKQGRKVYTNQHVLGAHYLNPDWLGKYMLYDVDIIIDEAQLVWDNREFGKFSKDMKYFISNYRHMKCRLWIISQSYEDLDVKIRRQAHHIYIMQPSWLPFTIMLQKVRMRFGINEQGNNIETLFKTSIFDLRFKLNWIVWKYFDSYSIPHLPQVPTHDEKYWGDVPTKQKKNVSHETKALQELESENENDNEENKLMASCAKLIDEVEGNSICSNDKEKNETIIEIT